MGRSSLLPRTRWLLVGVAALSVAVVFAVFYLAWTTYTLRLRTDDLSRQTQVIASGLESSADDGDVLGSELRMRLFRVQAGLIGATLALADPDGRIVAASDEERVGRTVPLERLGEADEDGVRNAVADVSGVGRVLMVAVPLETDDGLDLVALQPVREVNRTRGWVFLLLALSAAAAVAVAWVVGGWSARRLAGPILRLQRASESLGEGTWGSQVPVEGDDEIARLAGSFNRMSERLESAYRAQEEFVGNVSHEMRTPVTTIAGFSGALLDGTVSEPDTRERYLGLIHEEAERLGELAAVLLQLANLDAGVVEVSDEEVSLARIGDAMLERHGSAAAEKDIALDISFEGVLRADERLLAQAVSTLVENAVRFTPAGGTVRLSASSEPDGVAVRVEDSGPGIPPESREKVFERFARVDSSRSKGGGGSGLGLAICKRLVEAMGGSVSVEQSGLGGARFVIRLPGRASGAADST
jgi:signal transduction histidine kinase